jgi:hypothetical protein
MLAMPLTAAQRDEGRVQAVCAFCTPAAMLVEMLAKRSTAHAKWRGAVTALGSVKG